MGCHAAVVADEGTACASCGVGAVGLVGVVGGELADLRGGGVLVAHHGDAVDLLFCSAVGGCGIGHIDGFDAGVAVGVFEGCVVELDAVVDDAEDYALACVGLQESCLARCFVEVVDGLCLCLAACDVGKEATLAGNAHLVYVVQLCYGLNAIDGYGGADEMAVDGVDFCSFLL